MVRVTVWLQLLLVVLILRQSAAGSDQCSELREEISRLQQDIVNIRDLRKESVLRADNCTIELEIKEQVLKNNNETQTQLQTDIDGLTKTVQSMNQTIQRLCQTPEHACRYLIEAARYGDVDTAKILFKCSNDSCTNSNVNRDPPLIVAAWYGKLAVVRVLLEGGANVDRANIARSTALYVAAEFGRLDMCRLLLDWGANVDLLNTNLDTPLHNAARKGHLSVVKLLVERGADVSYVIDGKTASAWARSLGHKDVADWLDSIELETKEQVLKNNNETQIQLQTDIDGLTKTVQSMNRTIQRLCETPEHACRYLIDAARYGDVDTAKILFKCSNDSCTNSNVNRDPPLIVAAWYGKLAVVRVLLEGGANVDRANIARTTALFVAAEFGRLDMCRLLLDWGAKLDRLNKDRYTPLHWAAWNGHLSVVKLLVERGVDVSVRDNNGKTASAWARSLGHKDVADWLDTLRRG